MNSPHYVKTPLKLKGSAFKKLFQSADAFICGAGFEERALQVPLAANVIKNPIVIEYAHGPRQNNSALKKFTDKFNSLPGFAVCELDLAHIEKFEVEFDRILRDLRNIDGDKIVLDISGLPNFAICISIIKIRQHFPTNRLILLYTEAEEYFPQLKDFNLMKSKMMKKSVIHESANMSESAVNMYMPSMFSGVALGHNDTCLIVFAGYEPHRTTCVIDATNPSKLVMVYGEPERPDLKWRLELSRMMHCAIDPQLMKTEEQTTTSEISDNLNLIIEYYEHLYDDHVLCVCPTNSKMQGVAAALAWETYPDIQLNFPVPAIYLPKRFSLEFRDTFEIDLGLAPAARRFLH